MPKVVLGMTMSLDGIINDRTGSKDVTIIGGASMAQQCLKTGLVDELHVDIMPVLLCKSLRLFEQLGDQPIKLEKTGFVNATVRTHLKFRVIKP